MSSIRAAGPDAEDLEYETWDHIRPGGYDDWDEVDPPKQSTKPPKIDFGKLSSLPPPPPAPPPSAPPPMPSQPHLTVPSPQPHFGVEKDAIERYKVHQRLHTTVEIRSKQHERALTLLLDFESNKPQDLKQIQYIVDVTFTRGNMSPTLSREIRLPADHCRRLAELVNSITIALEDAWLNVMGENFVPKQQGCIYLEETVLSSGASPYGLMNLYAEATSEKYADWRKRNVVNGFAKTFKVFISNRIELTAAGKGVIEAHLGRASGSEAAATEKQKAVYSQSQKRGRIEKVEKMDKKKDKKRRTATAQGGSRW